MRGNTPISPQLIDELNEAAEQLVRHDDFEDACQVWLICAVLESLRGDSNKALIIAEKTAEFAEDHHLPKIHGWANWGASSLCARRGNLQKAASYLQRLEEMLNDEGEWMLANVIYILETSLYQLASAKQGAPAGTTTDPQMAIILEQFLHWESPKLTEAVAQTAKDEKETLIGRIWRAVERLFRGDTEPKPASKAFVELPIRESSDELVSLAAEADEPSEVEEMELVQDRPIAELQAAEANQPVPDIDKEIEGEVNLSVEPEQIVPSLTIYCLGPFRVYQDEKLIEEWPSGKGKSIFKYLLAHRPQPTAKEVLMELFWPDANPDAARNNLNVAIYGLRQALRNGYEDFSHVLFHDDHYFLNPKIRLWVDFEVFLDLCQTASSHATRGNWEQFVQDCHAAVSLYQGELFIEDRYEDWVMKMRHHLQDTYLSLVEQLSQYYFQNDGYMACIDACRHIIEVEPCHERTHRRLMRCFCRQGQHYLGIRQYHQCEEALRRELDVEPSPETTRLYEKVRRHESI